MSKKSIMKKSTKKNSIHSVSKASALLGLSLAMSTSTIYALAVEPKQQNNVSAQQNSKYHDQIQKLIVDDPTNLSEEQKQNIAKKLAAINNISVDKISFDNQGNAIMQLDAQNSVTIKNELLAVRKTDVNLPTGEDAIVVANPIRYAKNELALIQERFFEKNKHNPKLGLQNKEQVKVYQKVADNEIKQGGKAYQGYSNGIASNPVIVHIETNSVIGDFESNIVNNIITSVINIRTDYKVTWTQKHIDGRDSDEGWSYDKNGNVLLYHYDATKASSFTLSDAVKTLRANSIKKNQTLRTLDGDEINTLKSENFTHVHSKINDKGEPVAVLDMLIKSGPYAISNALVSGSDQNLAKENAKVITLKGFPNEIDNNANTEVAAKKGAIYRARLFVASYTLTYYYHLLDPNHGMHVTKKALEVVFVPQTTYKTSDLEKAIMAHNNEQDQGTKHDSTYYNASSDIKKAYENALARAKETLAKIKEKTKDAHSEAEKEAIIRQDASLRAELDNSFLTLEKAKDALNGVPTNKEALRKSYDKHGQAAEGDKPASGTQAESSYKNVLNPDFRKDDGSLDDQKNAKAANAKNNYDQALNNAQKVLDNKEASQKDVDDAKATLDDARAALNTFTTDKDKLNVVINRDGKVSHDDPTYQNATDNERTAYDNAVIEAHKLSADPKATQADVNKALFNLKKAKETLDKRATNKQKLDNAVKQSFDNPNPNDPNSKKSVFYQNAKNKVNDPNAQQAVKDYDDAITNAKNILALPSATQKQVDEALQKLKTAEENLHQNYSSDKSDLGKALADNVNGYLLPAYFNAHAMGIKEGSNAQSAIDFKTYNDAYHAAKKLLHNPQATQTEIDTLKDALINARKVIEKYTTDTTELTNKLNDDKKFNDNPLFKNVLELTKKVNDQSLDAKEKAKVTQAINVKKAYDEALAQANKVINNQLSKDVYAEGADKGKEIPLTNIPVDDTSVDVNSADYIKNIQSHANGEALQKDVDNALKMLDDAYKAFAQFETNTDQLKQSIYQHDGASGTENDPAYRNANDPNYLAKHKDAENAIKAYNQALNDAKNILNKDDITQKQVDETKQKLDTARKALIEKYKTDINTLKPLVDQNITDEAYYRNTTATDASKEAKEAMKKYDDSLAKAKELIQKHTDTNVPLSQKPTQTEIDNALAKLSAAQEGLKPFETKIDEIQKEVNDDSNFQKNAEYQNIKDRKETPKDPDLEEYEKALNDAKELIDKHNGLLNGQAVPAKDRPTQKQVDDALAKLNLAKKNLLDHNKTNVDNLRNEANKDPEFKKLAEFTNANDNKDKEPAKSDLAAYKSALDNANELLHKQDDPNTPNDQKPTQKQVDDALAKLNLAKKNLLDHNKTNVDNLRNEANKDPEFKKLAEFTNANDNKDKEPAKSDLAAYKSALDNANELLHKQDDPNTPNDQKPTQKQVDDALAKLNLAKKNLLDHNKTNKQELQKQVDSSNDVLNHNYLADESIKEEYKQAINEAHKLLKDTNATQVEVNAALAKLKAIEDKLRSSMASKVPHTADPIGTLPFTSLFASILGLIGIKKLHKKKDDD